MNNIILIIGIGLLIYDLILVLQDKTTISQWCQGLFPRGIDWIIGIGGCVLVCLTKAYWYRELDFNLVAVWLLFWGHIWLANRERYGKEK